MNPVTWTVEEAKALLSSAKMCVRSGRVQVYIQDEWLHLCREDLFGQVCTYGPSDSKKPLENVRTVFLEKIRYGARKTSDGKAFAVIDSLTDG